jgi:putative transposase
LAGSHDPGMPNSRRFHLPSVPQHVVQRGNDRRPCFLVEADYAEFLLRLAGASRKYSVAVHAYALMPNHVHLLATPVAADGIGRMMQAVGSGYVKTFNARHGRTGTLWDGRYFGSLVGTDQYFWNCHRYIELNPVRAGLVLRPEEFRWSSHARNALGRPDPAVTPHPSYLALAHRIGDVATAYRRMFATALAESAVTEIRYRLHTERAYGDEAFVEKFEADSRRSLRSRGPGRPAKADAGKIVPEEITTSDLIIEGDEVAGFGEEEPALDECAQ